jgi:hypothetical protein
VSGRSDDDVAQGPRARQVGERWTLLLPPGWITLPTAADRAHESIRRVVDGAMRGKPRDELVTIRIDLERALTEHVAQARAQGADTVHALVEPIAGVPVSASLLVAELVVLDQDQVMAEVQRMFGRVEGVVETGPAEVAGFPALRRVRRNHRSLDEAAGLEPVWHTNVDFVVETGPDELLVLIFATSDDVLAPQLVRMFDAMAQSLASRTD